MMSVDEEMKLGMETSHEILKNTIYKKINRVFAKI